MSCTAMRCVVIEISAVSNGWRRQKRCSVVSSTCDAARDVVGLLRHQLLGSPCHTPSAIPRQSGTECVGARQDEPCCICACPLIYPPTWCVCGGVWQGSCPSACTNCVCVLNECTCVGHVDYKACEADTCAVLDAAPKVEPSQQWAIEETGGKLATMV
ncbi:hypothetical protein MUK42_26184 [Musa troglodytarum]|uniref:Uncharacterized protein n=1 Tax=Musa troglodytarum TaxID=320322 RepID=A0A9E7K5D3_9LILI|nr:hypothetical protein MUK42_26184 [Musa troglodytarum]